MWNAQPVKISQFKGRLTRKQARWPHPFITFFSMFISWMLIMPSFKKSLIVEQFQRNYLKRLVYTPLDSSPRFTSNLTLSNPKNPAWFFILAYLLDRGMQRVNWLPPRTILARVFLKIIFRGCPIIHSFSNGAMLERLVNATLWCNR